jgi:hypothetical protein
MVSRALILYFFVLGDLQPTAVAPAEVGACGEEYKYTPLYLYFAAFIHVQGLPQVFFSSKFSAS